MTNVPSANAPAPRARRLILAVSAILLLVAFGVAWRWWPWREAQPEQVDAVDPRLTFATPYRNVRPEVKYVGDQVCAECHTQHAKTYRHHPMGQAMAPLADATPIERYDADAQNPFGAARLRYGVDRRKDRVVHREWVEHKDAKLAEIEADVPFACGSGTRARSYLVNFDGYLFQSPITWYPQGNRWDLSPGYERRNLHFTRPVTTACLFCHCNHAEHVPGTVNRYREPIFRGYVIGCERCHGPGELHVTRRESGERVKGLDDTIVNPARLEHSLREAVCQQCHVQGEQRVVSRGRADFDYRPGLPLHLFVMDFVDARSRRGDFKFVSSVEQMMASRCYQSSREPTKLGCISCHDPHKHPASEAEKIAHYRQRCLGCHTEQSCTLPRAARQAKSKEDSCIVCHMQRLGSEVQHTAITDHRVPRRPEPPVDLAKRSTPGPNDLVPFHNKLPELPEEEVSRNLGLALMGFLELEPPEPAARQYAQKALALLEPACKRDKHDFAAAEARGDALARLGRREEALALYESLLSQRPEAETALTGAGYVALALNRPEVARTHLERAVRVNSWNWHYHFGLARASFRLKEWDRAVRECNGSLRLNPASAQTRSLLVQCQLCLGQLKSAQTEYETLVRLTPDERHEELRLWFQMQQQRFLPAGPRTP